MPHSGIAKLSVTGKVISMAALKEITNFIKSHNYERTFLLSGIII
jgi:hypothetical protein